MQVGKVPSQILKENGDLVKDTVNAICDFIPESMLPQKISEAFKLRRLKNERMESISNQVLLHSSKYLEEKLETMDSINRFQFLDLLEAFVMEKWSNHETYNTFIKGFGHEFENFSDVQSVKFISLLVQAGLNQSDILDAVIEKVGSSKRVVKPSFVVDIVQAALDADVVDKSEAFTKFLESEDVVSLIKGEKSNQLKREIFRLDYSRKLKLLSSCIAKTDLKSESTLKDFVSGRNWF